MTTAALLFAMAATFGAMTFTLKSRVAKAEAGAVMVIALAYAVAIAVVPR